MFLETIKRKYQPGCPILVGDILLMFPNFTKAYVFRLLNKALESKEITRVSRGVYCVTGKTVLGYYTPSSRTVAERKYVCNQDDVFGVVSGLSLLNSFAVISQVPNDLEIVTNKEKTRRREIQIRGMNFVLRKSRFQITKENVKYYIVLQLFLEINKGFYLDDTSKSLIKDFIKRNKLRNELMMQYALAFPQSVTQSLIKSGVIYGTTQA